MVKIDCQISKKIKFKNATITKDDFCTLKIKTTATFQRMLCDRRRIHLVWQVYDKLQPFQETL